jgi:hypothetical protein
MEQVFKHWRNGKWGRLAWNDVKVYREGDVFCVVHLVDGVAGKRTRYAQLTEPDAVDIAKDLMSVSNDWRDMMN